MLKTLLVILLALLAAPIVLAFSVLGMFQWLLELLWQGATWPWRERGIGKCANDPIFGSITYEGNSTWSGEVELNALGGRLSVDVPASAEGPGPKQHELLRGVIERQDDLRRQVEEVVYQFYQANAPRWRKEWASTRRIAPKLAGEMLKTLPVLERPEQIWTLLSDGTINLDEELGFFSIQWNCTWDMEHGVDTTFVDWKIDDTEWE